MKAARRATSVFPYPTSPANQAVHGTRGTHVFEHVVDGARLIRRLLVGESGLEFLKERIRLREAEPFLDLAHGVEAQQFFGNSFGGLLGLLFGRLPGLAAEFVEARVLSFDAEILLDLLELVHGHIEPVPVQVVQEQKIALDSPDVQVDEFLVDPDPVIHVNDVVSHVKVLEGTQEEPGNRLLGPPSGPPAEDLFLRDHGQPLGGPQKTPFEHARQHLDTE